MAHNNGRHAAVYPVLGRLQLVKIDSRHGRVHAIITMPLAGPNPQVALIDGARPAA